MEFGYFFLCIAHSPREVIITKMLPEAEKALCEIQSRNASDSQNVDDRFWDDFCLVHFLMGVCLRYIAFPVIIQFLHVVKRSPNVRQDADAIIDPMERLTVSHKDASSRAVDAFEIVLKNGPKIQLDHHLVYYTR
jgi:hypothetical protein